MRHLNLAISGTEGARTFSQRAGGTLSVQKPAPVNKNTVAQIRRRGIFAAAASAYKKLRPDAWAWIAAQRKLHPQKDALGNTVVLSVYAYFVKLYLSGWRQLPDPTESENAAWDYVAALATGQWTKNNNVVALLLRDYYNLNQLNYIARPWRGSYDTGEIQSDFNAIMPTYAFRTLTINGKRFGSVDIPHPAPNTSWQFGLRKSKGNTGPAIFFRQYIS